MYSFRAGSAPNSRRMISGAALIAAFFAILIAFSPANADAANPKLKVTSVTAPSKMTVGSSYKVKGKIRNKTTRNKKGTVKVTLSKKKGKPGRRMGQKNVFAVRCWSRLATRLKP